MYTDASCKQGFGCGIGVFFGDRPPLSELNISERLVNVEQNSGLAEIKAARAGLDKLHRWPHYAYALI